MRYDEITHSCLAHVPPFEWTSRRGDATPCPQCHPGEPPSPEAATRAT